MVDTKVFGQRLNNMGYNFYSGVPCSFLKDLINFAINKQQFVMSANEGDAVAICAGAYLGGKKAVFLCQNSGLTNAVSPLTSLNYTFKIPVLGFVSLRGEEGLKDEPQHELLGKITDKLLDTMEIQYEVLSNNIETALEQLQKANEIIENGNSFFFIVKKGTFGKVILNSQESPIPKEPRMNFGQGKRTLPKRMEVLEKLQNSIGDNTLIIATTGVTGRELYELEDKSNQLYMVGSMGCVSSLALGLALARPDKKVIAIDGDGSLIMRMGSITTNAYYSPSNLYHPLLDNGAHESTGGQKTVSDAVNFVKIAEGASYQQIDKISCLDDLEESIHRWNENGGLTFGYIRTNRGIKENLGRPKMKPYQVKDRFMKFISGDVG